MPRANGSQRRPGSGYVGDGWRAGGENSDLFEISQFGNRIWENFQCDWIRAITTCFSTWNLNASRKNAFQKGKPVTAPEAPMHFRAPGKMSFLDCTMFDQRNPTYPLEMTMVSIRLHLWLLKVCSPLLGCFTGFLNCMSIGLGWCFFFAGWYQVSSLPKWNAFELALLWWLVS